MRTSLTKPGRTARDAVLDTLRRAYPNGVKSTDLIEQHGPAARSRITDLRNDGWDITTDEVGGVAYYSLASLTKGEAMQVLAGVVLRLDTRVGWTSRTHQEAQEGPVSSKVLDEAEAAALAAYKAVIARHGGVPTVHSVHTPPAPDLDEDEGYEPPEGWTGDLIDDDEEE